MARHFDPYHKWLAIPPEEQPANHYRLLGLKVFEEDPDVIESAADKCMAHLRSFQTGKNAQLAQKLLNEVSAARVCLLNPQQRATYDQTLRDAATHRCLCRRNGGRGSHSQLLLSRPQFQRWNRLRLPNPIPAGSDANQSTFCQYPLSLQSWRLPDSVSS